jgi:hypothetical protein
MGTDHTAENGAELHREDIKLLYQSLWSTKTRLRFQTPVATPETIAPSMLLGVISQDVVSRRVGKMKRSTAPGPNGIRV